MKELHFKSKEALRKYFAFQHIRTPTGNVAKLEKNTIAEVHPLKAKIYVKGRLHEVCRDGCHPVHHVHHHVSPIKY